MFHPKWACVQEHLTETLQPDQSTWTEPQGHPREGEGDLNRGPQQPIQPGRIPAAPRELPQLPSLLYTASLLFVVHIVVPWGRDLCVGLMCWVVLGSRLKLVRHVFAPGAPAGRCTGCCPIVPGKSRWCSWDRSSDPAGRPKP